jgi:hypothetical protein
MPPQMGCTSLARTPRQSEEGPRNHGELRSTSVARKRCARVSLRHSWTARNRGDRWEPSQRQNWRALRIP